MLPCDIAVETCGGLVDVYADVNRPEYHRWRLTYDVVVRLYHALGQHIQIRRPEDANQ